MGRGIHDIHLNHGNVGTHAGFHDGGLILAFPDRYLGLFLGFQTRCIPTDAAVTPHRVPWPSARSSRKARAWA